MGTIEAVVYHTVIAVCMDHIRVITGYIPEENKWIEYRKTIRFDNPVHWLMEVSFEENNQ